jgi:hypothetical protein
MGALVEFDPRAHGNAMGSEQSNNLEAAVLS